MELEQKENMYMDCSTPFSVILQGEITVGDLINEILKREEWGEIYLTDKLVRGKIIIARGKRYVYEGGQCDTIAPDVLGKKLIKADARGGYSQMNYYVLFEQTEQHNPLR